MFPSSFTEAIAYTNGAGSYRQLKAQEERGTTRALQTTPSLRTINLSGNPKIVFLTVEMLGAALSQEVLRILPVSQSTLIQAKDILIRSIHRLCAE